MKKFTAVVAFAALATLACTSDTIIINGDGWPVPTTPRAALRLLEYSFNHCNVATLKSCLNEDFVFYVDPEEYGRRGGAIPSSMTYTDFWRTAQNMFERAYSVMLVFDYNAVGEPGPEQTTHRAENINVKLLVMETESTGFLAEGQAGFEFEKYRSDAGEDRWRLRKWWDHTLPDEGEGGSAGPTPGIARTSVAAILAYYR